MGFGPGAISTTGLGTGRGLKWQNAADTEGYLAGPEEGRFRYSSVEDRLAVLTRRLVLLSAERPEASGTWPDAELQVLAEADLVTTTEDRIHLTERGTFYADSVAGLLAERHVARRRDDDAVPRRMG